jgi:hypothetical protein
LKANIEANEKTDEIERMVKTTEKLKNDAAALMKRIKNL